MFSNQNLQKICNKYYCEYCHYSTSRKSSYDEHILSTKHQKSMIGNQNLQKICNEYVCQNCNKKYKDNSGLWRHKKTCKAENNTDTDGENTIIFNETTSKDELIKYLMKENTELKNIILEFAKNVTVNKAVELL